METAVVATILLVISIVLWRQWFKLRFRKWHNCIVCGKKTNHYAAFCSNECSLESRNTNWQQSYIRHRDREIEYLKKKNIEKYGKIIGDWLPVFVDDGPSRLTLNQFKDTLRFFDWNCCYCGIKVGNNAQLEHLVPVSKGGLYIKQNIIPVCNICNAQKGAKDVQQFYIDKPVHEKYQKQIAKFIREPFWLEVKR